MENKINRKINSYIEKYREIIHNKIRNLNLDNDTQNELLKTIYSVDTLSLNKEDFIKRKRVVTQIPIINRCTAKKANGEQCTRKKKEGCNFCGTHDKFQPHGIVTNNECVISFKKCCISIMDINGINYYVDDSNNVYNTADILKNSNSPNIIGKVITIKDKIEFIAN